jgi:hypothetical protein
MIALSAAILWWNSGPMRGTSPCAFSHFAVASPDMVGKSTSALRSGLRPFYTGAVIPVWQRAEPDRSR